MGGVFKITLSASSKKLEKSMPDGTPKVVIVDAERHRRTPRLSAISGKAIDVWGAVFYGLWPIQCATLAEIGDAAITVLSKIGIEKVKQFYCKTRDKIKQISCQNLQNITNVALKI